MTSLTFLRLVRRTSLALTALALCTLTFEESASAFDSPVVIESPLHGSFLDEDTVEVSGRVGSAFEFGATTFTRPTEAANGEGNGSVEGTIAYTAEGYRGSLVANAEWFWEIGCCFESVRAELVIDSFALDEFGNAESLSGLLKATYYYDIFEIQYYEEEFAFTEADISMTVVDGGVMQIGPFGTVGAYVMYGAQFDVALEQVTDGWTLEVNGVPTSIASDGTWSASVTLDRDAIVNPIVASGWNGVDTYVDRVVVAAGSSLNDGELSPRAVAAHTDESAIEEILDGETVESMIDWEGVGNISSKECTDFFIFCWNWREMEVRETPEVRGGTEVDLTFADDGSEVSLSLKDLWIKARLKDDFLTTGTWCGLEIESDVTATVQLDLQPDPDDPRKLKLADNAISMNVGGYSHEWTYGQCSWGIFDWFFDWFVDSVVEDKVGEKIEDAVKTELPKIIEQLNVTGLVSGPLEPLGISIDAPFSEVTADSTGLTVVADLGATSICESPDGAPALGASYSKVNPEVGPFPLAGFPIGFNFAASVSTSAANQVLKTQIECGLLLESVDEIDIFSNGTLYPTTLGFLSVLIGALNDLTKSEEAGGYGMDPLTLVRIDVQPTMAPILVSGGGPNGESLGLKVPQLLIRMIDTGLRSNFPAEGTTPTGRPERLLVEAATDFEMGIDLESYGDEVGFSIGLPPSEAIEATVVGNPFHLDALSVEGVVPGLVNRFVPELLDALDTIPLPELLGEQVFLSDPYTEGEYIGVYASYGEPSVTLTMNVTAPSMMGQIKLGENVNGEVICDAQEGCTMKVPVNGGPVTIRAWSHTYPYFFSHWSGACSGGNSRCTIDPSNGDIEVTAHFFEDHG